MPTLYCMLGLPGAGKSTYVTNVLVPRGVQVVCADDIRLAHGHRYFGPLEAQIHGLCHTFAHAHLLRGLSVVIDEATTRAGYVRRWRMLADDFDFAFRVIHVTTPAVVCRERLRERSPDFPLEVIDMKASLLAENLPRIKAMLAGGEYEEIA